MLFRLGKYEAAICRVSTAGLDKFLGSGLNHDRALLLHDKWKGVPNFKSTVVRRIKT